MPPDNRDTGRYGVRRYACGVASRCEREKMAEGCIAVWETMGASKAGDPVCGEGR